MNKSSTDSLVGVRLCVDSVDIQSDEEDNSIGISIHGRSSSAQTLSAQHPLQGLREFSIYHHHHSHTMAGPARITHPQHQARSRSMMVVDDQNGMDMPRSISTPHQLDLAGMTVGVSNRGSTATTVLHHHHMYHHASGWPVGGQERILRDCSPSSLPKKYGRGNFGMEEDAEIGFVRTAHLFCCCTRSGKSSLWRIFAVCLGVMVVMHILSCGVLFFLRMPGGHKSLAELMYDDLEPEMLHSEARLLVQSDMLRRRYHPDDKIKLIPKIIHQTFKSNTIPGKLKPLMQSWREFNPNYEIRFYDDAACRHFVATEFPEYFEAYQSLPKDVERADFFRYMVVLRFGGVYADIDTECRVPVDNYVRASDTLVVGWENEFASDDEAFARHFVRRRQILQWLFMGVPGHPVLRGVCDRIARVAKFRFSNNTNRDTLERTGPGMWTDMVLRRSFSRGHSVAADDPWGVRVLPRVAFGAHPTGADGIPPTSPSVFALHHYMGSWKVSGGWNQGGQSINSLIHSWTARRDKDEERSAFEVVHALPDHLSGPPPHVWSSMPLTAEDAKSAASRDRSESGVNAGRELAEQRQEVAEAGATGALSLEQQQQLPVMVTDLFPVSAMWDPPFDILVLMLGEDGEAARAKDPSAPIESASSSITNWGTWHPGVHPTRRPGLAEALVGSLGGHRRSAVLVDVGAGVGFFSLAAAARGHKAVAFETRPKHVRAIRASVKQNGFKELLSVHNTPLGSDSPAFCASWTAREASEASTASEREGSGGGGGESSFEHVISDIRMRVFGGAPTAEEAGVGATAVDDAVRLPNEDRQVNCTLPAEVRRLDDVLAKDLEVGAMRISVDGMEGWVLEGATELMTRRPPPIVVIELKAPSMHAVGSDPLEMLHRMWDWGYTHISHSGPFCDGRWRKIAAAHRFGGYVHAGTGAGRMEEALKQPTWCKMSRPMFEQLLEQGHHTLPETVLFHHMDRPNMLEQERLARLVELEQTVLSNPQANPISKASN
eukprot:CAMPEP_0114247346 /NCGR_PEP_ID=MMETSP0058-20121206/12974_1 /TAXON_ID=36894 /ORGANISM="Pyramimonas parkeae, CCMP726" /LENGTH=1002 /DNA_ID=CAMNT_0001360647 /DNA_START=399 /DNA_END=3407 /DNA_ORIENTATION=+